MFRILQATSVWITAASLLTQAVCPGLVPGCGCWKSRTFNPFTGGSSISCCSPSETEPAKGCPHCHQAMGESSSVVQNELICHCINQAPAQPTPPQIPDSSEAGQLLNGNSGETGCAFVAPMLSGVRLERSQVPSIEALVPNFTQVIYCVRLT